MPILEWKYKTSFKISKIIFKPNKNVFYNYIIPVGKKEVSTENWKLIQDECAEQIRKGNLRIIPETKKKDKIKRKENKNNSVDKEKKGE